MAELILDEKCGACIDITNFYAFDLTSAAGYQPDN